MSEMTVASTILAQMGGHRILNIMAGCKDFVGYHNGVHFKVGRNSKGVTKMQIILEADDTYTVKFFGRGTTIKASLEGVYCDQLRSVFENHTGMYLTFAPRA